eukprot:g6215.t1
MSTTCLDLVLNLVILVSYLAEDAVRLKTHLFAQLYLTELRLSPPGTAAEGVAVALPVDRAAPASRGHVPFVFRRWRCCLRYHVLLQLLEEIAQQRAQETKTPVSVSMIEIGVHTASTARFLLDRAPFLHWTGIDPYEDHSGDALFHEASRHLARFGHRARLLRRRSEEAWETSGALHGSSVLMDLLGRAKGGIVAGHDIFNPVNDGVTEAVEDLLRGKNVVVNFATDHVFWWHTRNPRAEAEAKAITRHLVQLGEVSWVQALDFLAQLEGKNVVHWNTVISACGKARQWAAARELQLSKDRRCQWQRAIALLQFLPAGRVQADEVSFNTTMSACSVHLKWQHALALREVMRRRQLQEDQAWTGERKEGPPR